jgi:hypothetical protein
VSQAGRLGRCLLARALLAGALLAAEALLAGEAATVFHRTLQQRAGICPGALIQGMYAMAC